MPRNKLSRKFSDSLETFERKCCLFCTLSGWEITKWIFVPCGRNPKRPVATLRSTSRRETKLQMRTNFVLSITRKFVEAVNQKSSKLLQSCARLGNFCEAKEIHSKLMWPRKSLPEMTTESVSPSTIKSQATKTSCNLFIHFLLCTSAVCSSAVAADVWQHLQHLHFWGRPRVSERRQMETSGAAHFSNMAAAMMSTSRCVPKTFSCLTACRYALGRHKVRCFNSMPSLNFMHHVTSLCEVQVWWKLVETTWHSKSVRSVFTQVVKKRNSTPLFPIKWSQVELCVSYIHTADIPLSVQRGNTVKMDLIWDRVVKVSQSQNDLEPQNWKGLFLLPWRRRGWKYTCMTSKLEGVRKYWSCAVHLFLNACPFIK